MKFELVIEEGEKKVDWRQIVTDMKEQIGSAKGEGLSELEEELGLDEDDEDYSDEEEEEDDEESTGEGEDKEEDLGDEDESQPPEKKLGASAAGASGWAEEKPKEVPKKKKAKRLSLSDLKEPTGMMGIAATGGRLDNVIQRILEREGDPNAGTGYDLEDSMIDDDDKEQQKKKKNEKTAAVEYAAPVDGLCKTIRLDPHDDDTNVLRERQKEKEKKPKRISTTAKKAPLEISDDDNKEASATVAPPTQPPVPIVSQQQPTTLTAPLSQQTATTTTIAGRLSVEQFDELPEVVRKAVRKVEKVEKPLTATGLSTEELNKRLKELAKVLSETERGLEMVLPISKRLQRKINLLPETIKKKIKGWMTPKTTQATQTTSTTTTAIQPPPPPPPHSQSDDIVVLSETPSVFKK